MLAFTPEVELALRRFDDRYTLVNADGRFWWQPLAPSDERAGNRDHEAVLFLRDVHNDLVRPRKKKAAASETDG